MRHIGKRVVLIVLLGAFTVLLAFLFTRWRQAISRGGQTAAEPFRIAGNFYYVGASDAASFLITGPEGHVLIDAGYSGSTSLITESIAKLGFNIKDVKAVLSSEPHQDHAGGLHELQVASGAQIWASGATAEAIVHGGEDDSSSSFFLMDLLRAAGIEGRYPPARVDHRVTDGERIRVGSIEVTAHITPGHTKACTSWTFRVRDGNRDYNVVSACSLEILTGMRFVEPQKYPGIRDDFERSFRILRSLPADIWVTSHARAFGRYRKYVESTNASDPVAPFVDREGYKAYVDSAEARFRRKVAEQEAKK